MIHQYFREITVHHVMSVSEERGTLNRQLLLGPGSRKARLDRPSVTTIEDVNCTHVGMVGLAALEPTQFVLWTTGITHNGTINGRHDREHTPCPA
jgi:hypothetical protein